MIATLPTSGRRRSTSIAAAAALTVALGILAALPAAAFADAAKEIRNRCGEGKSLSGFTVAQYKRALDELPTEVMEYSDCAELILQAENAAAGHRGGSQGSGGGASGGGSGGSSSGPGAGGVETVQPTPAQQRILEQTRKGKLAPVHLDGAGGEAVLPGVVHPDLASATSSLPTPVLAVIALVVAGLLLLAGREIRERIARSRQS